LVISASGPDSEALAPPLRLAQGDAGDPAPARRSDPEPGRWLLVVGRAEDGQLVWAPTVFGGIRRAICSGETYRELIVNNRLGATLTGAGAFDLDGMMVGVVATCGGTERIISTADVPRLLAAFDTPARRTRRDYGLTVEELPGDVAQGVPSNTGLLVTEIHVGGMADGAGLRAGDIITGAKDQAFSKPEDLFGALRSENSEMRVLQVIRGERKVTVTMPAVMEARHAKSADESLGIRVVAAKDGTKTVVTAVGTPAYTAGLRTGDKLIQAGGKDVTAKTLAQAVAAAGDKPLMVVYERNGMQRVALVKR
jgi:S1-C subfamily serine protease